MLSASNTGGTASTGSKSGFETARTDSTRSTSGVVDTAAECASRISSLSIPGYHAENTAYVRNTLRFCSVLGIHIRYQGIRYCSYSQYLG